MDVTSETLAALGGTYEALSQALGALAERVSWQDAALPAYACELPVRQKGESPGGRIACRSLGARQARQFLGGHLANLRYSDGQDARAVQRLPGLVAAAPETMALVDEVNGLKKRFENEAKQLDATSWSALRRRQPFARLNLLQVYKKIPTLPVAPRHVHFFWQRYATSGSRMTVADVRGLVASSLNNAPELSAAEKMSTFQEEIRALADLPADELLVLRRPIAPHPEVLPWVGLEVQGALPAVMPLFYPATPETRVPTGNLLEDFEPGLRERAVRSDRKCEDEPILPRLHVYRYRETQRQYQPLTDVEPSNARLAGNAIEFDTADGPLSVGMTVDQRRSLLQALPIVMLEGTALSVELNTGRLRLQRSREGVSLTLADRAGQPVALGLWPRATAARLLSRYMQG